EAAVPVAIVDERAQRNFIVVTHPDTVRDPTVQRRPPAARTLAVVVALVVAVALGLAVYRATRAKAPLVATPIAPLVEPPAPPEKPPEKPTVVAPEPAKHKPSRKKAHVAPSTNEVFDRVFE